MPPTTGYQHARCYARALSDCATKISLEHYWTEAITKLIFPSAEFVLHDAAGLELELSVKDAGRNMLCTRHNVALSQADEVALRLFQSLPDLFLTTEDCIPSVNAVFFDGQSLERWMLKTLYGFAAAGLLRRSDGTPLEAGLDASWLRVLFGLDRWPLGCGMYQPAKIGGSMRFSYDGLHISPFLSAGQLVGCQMSLGGWSSNLALRPIAPGQDYIYRPQAFRVQGARAALVYRFYWAEGERSAPGAYGPQ